MYIAAANFVVKSICKCREHKAVLKAKVLNEIKGVNLIINVSDHNSIVSLSVIYEHVYANILKAA